VTTAVRLGEASGATVAATGPVARRATPDATTDALVASRANAERAVSSSSNGQDARPHRPASAARSSRRGD
jgi:hypothetical protein